MAEPTNGELLKEIKAVHAVLEDHEARLKPLEQWKIAYDAADAAITKYKQEHQDLSVSMKTAPHTQSLLSDGVNKDFLKLVGSIVALLSAVVGVLYLIAQSLLQ
jgi:hypothetical protein